MWSFSRRVALLCWIAVGLALSGFAANGALLDAEPIVVEAADLTQEVEPLLPGSAVLNNSAAVTACDYPGACSPPVPPLTLQCSTGVGIYSPSPGVIELSDVDPCPTSILDQLVGCSPQGASIGWGSNSVPVSAIVQGLRFDTAASARGIVDQNGAAYSLYDCGGSAVTVVRSLYVD